MTPALRHLIRWGRARRDPRVTRCVAQLARDLAAIEWHPDLPVLREIAATSLRALERELGAGSGDLKGD